MLYPECTGQIESPTHGSSSGTTTRNCSKRARTQLFLAVVVLFFVTGPVFAALGSPIVWLADDVSLKGYTQVILYPVSNDTGERFEFDVAAAIADSVRTALSEAGLQIIDHDESESEDDALILKSSIVFYAPGSVGGRWIGMGGGAAVCILRTYVIAKDSDEIMGEIIVAKQVATGGLFSAGAGKSVPDRTAREMVEEFTALLGLVESK